MNKDIITLAWEVADSQYPRGCDDHNHCIEDCLKMSKRLTANHVLVPKEPTEAMIEEAFKLHEAMTIDSIGFKPLYIGIYNAMLSAHKWSKSYD